MLKRSMGAIVKWVSAIDIAAWTWRNPFTQLSGRSIFFSLTIAPDDELTVKPEGSMSNRVFR